MVNMWDPETGDYTGEPITAETFAELLSKVKPLDAYQQEVLNHMMPGQWRAVNEKLLYTNIILLFGPGHGHTMKLSGPPADEVVWQAEVRPTFKCYDDATQDEMLRGMREGRHVYRMEDELESSNMEECVIYVHHEKCCEQKMPGRETSRQTRFDIF